MDTHSWKGYMICKKVIWYVSLVKKHIKCWQFYLQDKSTRGRDPGGLSRSVEASRENEVSWPVQSRVRFQGTKRRTLDSQRDGTEARTVWAEKMRLIEIRTEGWCLEVVLRPNGWVVTRTREVIGFNKGAMCRDP